MVKIGNRSDQCSVVSPQGGLCPPTNEKIAKELRRNRILQASRKVREESMRINAEFAEIEDAPNE